MSYNTAPFAEIAVVSIAKYTKLRVEEGGCAFATGISYRIEASTDFTHWSTIETNIPASELATSKRLAAFVAPDLRVLLLPTCARSLSFEEAVQMLPAPQQKTLLRRLAKRLGKEDASCYDLVHELFEKPGRLGASGKRNLSTNKAHLAGFGLARKRGK